MHECPQRGLRLQHLNTHANGGFGPFAAGAELPTAAMLRPIQWRLRAQNDEFLLRG
jgi:hypothetical protein